MLDDDPTPTPCADCGINLTPNTPEGSHDWQRYMVHGRVWAEARMRVHDGWLCIRCLQKRLGRALTAGDFEHIPLNDPDRDDDDPELAALKRAAWQPCSSCEWCRIRYSFASNPLFADKEMEN